MRGNAALNISKIAVINARLVFNETYGPCSDMIDAYSSDAGLKKLPPDGWIDLQYKAIYASLILFKCNGVY